MVSKKPRIVVIGAGMAGLTAANKLYTSTSSSSEQLFELLVVEGGTRIGGRINSSEFCGDRIEQGATWIHGIEGSPVYKIAQERNLLKSHQKWECMDGMAEHPVTVAEGGHELDPSCVEPVSSLFESLVNFIQDKAVNEDTDISSEIVKQHSTSNLSSVGSFLRNGLEAYLGGLIDQKSVGKWSRKSIEEAIFAMHESTQRTFTSADELESLDCNAESEYIMFPGEEITIARGYSSVIESLASVLPVGMVQLGRKVEKIEWQPELRKWQENGHGDDDDTRPVKLHFCDGSTLSADHVIVTVSLGVLKHGRGMFSPRLPSFKTRAISRLGYGVVNKVFLQLQETNKFQFPFMQMVFHQQDPELRDPKIPHWIRRTSSLYPIYTNSKVVLSWFTGKEALELESLSEDEIIDGFSATVSNLLSSKLNCEMKPNCSGSSENSVGGKQLEFGRVLRTQWGTNPLFFGSYSYVAVGSSGDDMDTLAEPLPQNSNLNATPQLQILFAGEATHRTHYSTTHGAYFSGLREANRLLKHYNFSGV